MDDPFQMGRNGIDQLKLMKFVPTELSAVVMRNVDCKVIDQVLKEPGGAHHTDVVLLNEHFDEQLRERSQNQNQEGRQLQQHASKDPAIFIKLVLRHVLSISQLL